jgi:hypothetical protein
MDSGSLVAWLTLLLLAVNAVFVWLYLQETKKIRIANEDQLEGQIRPAIVVHNDPAGRGLELVNLGAGPALHLKLCKTERGSGPKSDLDRLPDEIGFLEVGGTALTGTRTQGGGIVALNGRSLQCEYTSLSGRTYWTVADFDKFDNNRLIATRFYSERR